FSCGEISDVSKMGMRACFSSSHSHQSGTQHAICDQVALLQGHHDRIGRLFGGNRRNGLVMMRVELLARLRGDLDQLMALECRDELAQCRFDTSLPCPGVLV